MRKYQWFTLMLLALTILFAQGASAQTPSISHQEKSAIVEALNDTLVANYVFTDMALKTAAKLREQLQAGEYDTVNTKEELAQKLSVDLVNITGDQHFFVGVDPKWVAGIRLQNDPVRKAEVLKEELAELAKINFGFNEVRILDGNIGYIRFNYFANPKLAYNAAAAVMRFVENSDAVIIDLRYNRGGFVEMAQFLASYFFSSDKDQLLFDYYYVEGGKRIERGQWVLPGLPGKRMTDKPLYILTGSTSFSSAEWFAYTMKKLGRATLIGERTSGSAHPVGRKPIDDDFFLQVPIGQIFDPVSHSDFQGIGVQPDIPTPSINAFALAHKMAFENLSKNDELKRDDYAWMLPALMAKIQSPDIDASILQAAAGKYEGREIVLENGKLYYLWRDRFRVALEPISPNLFAVEGLTDFRYRLIYQNGNVTALERLNKAGSSQVYKRND